MKLDAMKNALSCKLGRQVLQARKHSPTILFAGGVVGVATSTVLACRATLKLEETLEEAEKMREKIELAKNVSVDPRYDGEKYTDEDAKRDQFLITMKTAGKIGKLYAPAAAVGVISVAALTGSHVVLSKRNAAVVAAYSALEKGFDEYRSRVREELGEEKDIQFRHGSYVEDKEVVETEDGTKEVNSVVFPEGTIPSVYARFFDEFSTNWNRQPEYNQVFLNCQQRYANDLLHSRGHVFLNEVYDMLGISRSKAGAVVGWILSKNGDNYIDFGVYNVNDQQRRAFVNGDEKSILLDFNVDGVIYDKI